MRDLNKFAEQQPKSYATRANAQRAVDKVRGLASLNVGVLILMRATDGRWAVIGVNPDSLAMALFLGHGFGVWGTAPVETKGVVLSNDVAEYRFDEAMARNMEGA